MKRKEPSGWGEALPAPDADDETDEEEDEDDQPARKPSRAAAVEDDEDDDSDEEEDDEADDEPVPTKKSVAVDPDVEAEFEAGKLKKIRETPKE